MAHTISVRVYYEDTDAGDVVYYASYLRYLERARMEFMIDNGIDIVDYHRRGLFFAVAHLEVHYKRPARLGDYLKVTTEVLEVKNASLRIKNEIWRDNSLILEAYLTLACINREGKPVRLPEAFNSLKV